MYRCDSCGNKTRFDITETKRVKAFHHFSLGGDDTIEEEEVLDRTIESIVCRWCGSSDVTQEVSDPTRASSTEAAATETAAARDGEP